MAKWEDIKMVLKEKFSSAAEKTEEYTKIGKVRVEILAVKKNLDKAYKKLGEETVVLLGKDKKNVLLENDTVKDMLKDIKALQTTIKDKEKEIEAIKEESDSEKEKDTEEAKSNDKK